MQTPPQAQAPKTTSIEFDGQSYNVVLRPTPFTGRDDLWVSDRKNDLLNLIGCRHTEDPETHLKARQIAKLVLVVLEGLPNLTPEKPEEWRLQYMAALPTGLINKLTDAYQSQFRGVSDPKAS
jgi:hypothetical protein